MAGKFLEYPTSQCTTIASWGVEEMEFRFGRVAASKRSNRIYCDHVMQSIKPLLCCIPGVARREQHKDLSTQTACPAKSVSTTPTSRRRMTAETQRGTLWSHATNLWGRVGDGFCQQDSAKKVESFRVEKEIAGSTLFKVKP